MSQIIITTQEELEHLLRSIVGGATPSFPPEVLELELLKRKETLTTEEVEILYGLKASTLRKRRMNGEGPAYSKDGDKVLYTHTAIKKYLEAKRQKTYDQT